MLVGGDARERVRIATSPPCVAPGPTPPDASLARRSPRKHREGIPTARHLQPVESYPSEGTSTPTGEAAVPAAMPPAGGRNLMGHADTA